MIGAYSIHVQGVVQGVGFRPFVYRLACAHGLGGWVINAEEGVELHIEGPPDALQSFLDKLKTELMTALHRDFHEDVLEIYFSDYLVE